MRQRLGLFEPKNPFRRPQLARYSVWASVLFLGACFWGFLLILAIS
jgi:hypothetical protein